MSVLSDHLRKLSASSRAMGITWNAELFEKAADEIEGLQERVTLTEAAGRCEGGIGMSANFFEGRMSAECILDYEPQLVEDRFGPERSLRWLVHNYYGQHLSSEKARETADRYVAAITALLRDSDTHLAPPLTEGQKEV